MNIYYFWCGLVALMCNKVTIGLQGKLETWWSGRVTSVYASLLPAYHFWCLSNTAKYTNTS